MTESGLPMWTAGSSCKPAGSTHAAETLSDIVTEEFTATWRKVPSTWQSCHWHSQYTEYKHSYGCSCSYRRYCVCCDESIAKEGVPHQMSLRKVFLLPEEENNLWCEPRRRLPVHFIACVHEILSKFQVAHVPWPRCTSSTPITRIPPRIHSSSQ